MTTPNLEYATAFINSFIERHESQVKRFQIEEGASTEFMERVDSAHKLIASMVGCIKEGATLNEQERDFVKRLLEEVIHSKSKERDVSSSLISLVSFINNK